MGVEQPAEVEKEDDMFEVYRKRMMLAYRFRPNPLVRITANTIPGAYECRVVVHKLLTITMNTGLCCTLFLFLHRTIQEDLITETIDYVVAITLLLGWASYLMHYFSLVPDPQYSTHTCVRLLY